MDVLRDQVKPTPFGDIRFDEVMMDECLTCGIKGLCCSIFMVPLTQEEATRLELHPAALRRGIAMLRKHDDGACWYQDRRSGKCTIHESRPVACREYTCVGDERIGWLIQQGLGKRFITPQHAARIIKKKMKAQGYERM